MTGYPFDVLPSAYEEDNTLALSPDKLVAHLALGKAAWVAKSNPQSVVIGADTLVSLDGKIIGKPRDKEELVLILSALSGRPHAVLSGIAIIEGDHVVSESVETKVFFRKLDRNEIDCYAGTDEWKDKAGGYGIQSAAALFIDRIEGDYLNVVGLPLSRLAQRLKEFDVDLLAKQ